MGRVSDNDENHRAQSERDFSQGLPDHHNPLGGIGGAPAALSALTLRLVLAAVGCALSVVGAVVAYWVGAPAGIIVAFIVVAALAAVNIVVVARRKRRGEPG